MDPACRVVCPGPVLPARHDHPDARRQDAPDQPEEQEEIRSCLELVHRESEIQHHTQSLLNKQTIQIHRY